MVAQSYFRPHFFFFYAGLKVDDYTLVMQDYTATVPGSTLHINKYSTWLNCKLLQIQYLSQLYV